MGTVRRSSADEESDPMAHEVRGAATANGEPDRVEVTATGVVVVEGSG